MSCLTFRSKLSAELLHFARYSLSLWPKMPATFNFIQYCLLLPRNGLDICLLTLFIVDKTAAISQTIFEMNFFNEKFCILIKISLKFVPKSPIDNKPTSLEIMAWRRIGDKPLSEPKLTRFPEHRCDTTGGWAKVCLEVPGVEVSYQGICRCEFLLNLWYNRQRHDLLIWTAVMLWNGHSVLHMCFPSQRPLVTYIAYKYDVILMTLRLSHTLRILTCEIEMVRYVARTLQPCDN